MPDSGSFGQNFWSTLVFAWPWMFLLLGLPWAVRRLNSFQERPTDDRALWLPLFELLPEAGRVVPPQVPGRAHRKVSWVHALVYVLLVVAAARPQWIDGALARPVSGRDVLLMLDVSASMRTKDLHSDQGVLSRLAAAKILGKSILQRPAGDRVGLLVFAGEPYLYVPLTYDLAAVGAALDFLDVGLAGQKTALGDAVSLAVNVLSAPEHASNPPQHSGTSARSGAVAILISDGSSTGGQLSVEQSAWLAARQSVRVHSIALGADQGRETLAGLSGQTGGIHAHATDAEAVARFFEDISRAEPVAFSDATTRLHGRELYFFPVALAACLLLMNAMMNAGRAVLRHRRSGMGGADV